MLLSYISTRLLRINTTIIWTWMFILFFFIVIYYPVFNKYILLFHTKPWPIFTISIIQFLTVFTICRIT